MPRFTVPANVFIGSGALTEASDTLKSLGKKAFIVTGKHVVKSPMMAQLVHLLAKLRIAYEIYDDITGEPTDVMIKRGVALFKFSGCDFCIGIGGGSPIDSAKAIAVMVNTTGTVSDLNGTEITADAVPVAAIPTTAGTGSEATRFTVITDSANGIKMLLKGDCLVPAAAIINPEFTASSPCTVTASTGLDALTHAVEAYTSKKAFSLTDTLAESAVVKIMKYLPAAYKNGADKQARAAMSSAAFEAGVCINNSSVTLVHGMSRPIGALFHVPHGMSNAMLLGECLTFAFDGAVEKFARLGVLTGAAQAGDSSGDAAVKFISSIEALCKECRIPSLKNYGIDKKEYYRSIDKMAKDAVDSGSPANTVKKVDVGDCVEIYKRLYP